ncbi:MAG: 3-deoxy-manno-octulosonate cytidylyltransferase [Verrucomicrobiota bacterium]
MSHKIIAVIPARYASTRFPKKMLASLCGKPLLQWVWEGVQKSQYIKDILVATDHIEIQKLVEGFGCHAVMTDPGLPSGTDRVAAAIKNSEADLVINVQGDEPQVDGRCLDDLIDDMGDCPIGTLARAMHPTEDCTNPNLVKVVTDSQKRALYFSRAPIPYPRDGEDKSSVHYYQHLGIYCYQRVTLQKLVKLSPSPLEQTEKLEQLRALENGIAIRVVPTSLKTIGVDTPEDLQHLEKTLGK